MCIKIVFDKNEFEYEPKLPFMFQTMDSKKIIIDYDSKDNRIQSFLEEMEKAVKDGSGQPMNILINPNNSLDGLRFERKVEKLNRELEINGVVGSLTQMHHNTDKKLCEIKSICMKESE